MEDFKSIKIDVSFILNETKLEGYCCESDIAIIINKHNLGSAGKCVCVELYIEGVKIRKFLNHWSRENY